MSKPLWTGTARARWAVPVSLLMLVVAAVAFVTPGWYTGFILIVAAGLVFMFRRITVTVDRKQLTVRYGAPWTWPQRVARKDIRSVAVVDVRPMRWGGWGYRGSLRIFRRAAIILRAGEALEIELKNGRRLVISVDDAAGGVATLEA